MTAASDAEVRHGGGFSPYLRNAGLTRGEGEGTFVTGDLCPTPHRFDRAFFEQLEQLAPRAPVALAITGGWMNRHAEDFQWLQQRVRAGGLDIVWINHSYHHPYAIGRSNDNNFLLSAGVDMNVEIFDTERLLIANGETPSVFFRFPGLVSNPALMDTVRRAQLVALGADAWLAVNNQARPGSIVLVHPNGNEPDGIRLFSRMVAGARLPLPLRSINEAPAGVPLRGTLDEACAVPDACAKAEKDGN